MLILATVNVNVGGSEPTKRKRVCFYVVIQINDRGMF